MNLQKVKRILLILFAMLNGIILLLWINEVFNEIQVDFSHGDFSRKEDMSSMAHDRIYHDGWTLVSRLWNLFYGIPFVIFFLLAVNSLRKKNEKVVELITLTDKHED